MSETLKPEPLERPDQNPEGFQSALVAWFQEVAKPYPWRRTRDPYAILVSEIMLQQTQIATVLERGYYDRWLAQFPDFSTLARAPEAAVLRAWEGLGYYRRARNLHRLAKTVTADHGGVLPRTVAEVLALPGIGRYTAGAVLSFAYDLPEPVVDGNVLRLFARLFDFRQPVDSGPGQRKMWAWARDLAPRRGARLYNGALMELGQTLCRPRKPSCLGCPVVTFCQCRAPETLPVKRPRRPTVFQDEHVLFQVEAGSILLMQEAGRRREGLWKLPVCPEPRGGPWPLIYKAKYSITHHRVTLHVHRSQGASVPEAQQVRLTEIDALAMAAPYRKALTHLLKESDGFRLES